MKKTVFVAAIFTSANLFAYPAINEFAVDFPFDGGGFVSYTRSWVISPYMDVGVSAGGGVINREFDVTYPAIGDVTYETKALVVPFIGPRVGLHYEFIGLSVGYGAFYADTDIDARDRTGNTYTGSEKGWGTGFYAPLLVLDFYNNRRDMYFGVGLGGFLGANYPNLEATRGATTLVSDESPVDSLTITFRMRFFDGHGQPATHAQSDDF